MLSNKLTVTQLNNYVKNVFDDELILKNIAVFGEISEKNESGDTTFITLKDEGSILRCVHFKKDESVAVGDTVVAVGSVEYYAKGNRVSFIIRTLELFGEGKLRQEFLKLKETLRGEGLFECSLALPTFVKKVGVITSDTGAVIHDMMTVLSKRHGYIDVQIFPVRVQGSSAEMSIVSALAVAGESDCDLIVIARGGGSQSDLEAFNTERVARAVAAAKKPTISAVGHETDYTLCDFCSSLRAGTPSIAAENICRINESYYARVYELLSRLNSAASRLVSRTGLRTAVCAKRLNDSAVSLYYRNRNKVASLCDEMTERVQNLTVSAQNRIKTAIISMEVACTEKLNGAHTKLQQTVGSLNALSPLGIIEKGYAKVFSGGKPLCLGDVKVGDELNVYVAEGEVLASVKRVRVNKE